MPETTDRRYFCPVCGKRCGVPSIAAEHCEPRIPEDQRWDGRS